MKLLVTRPAPDAGPLAALLTAAGHAVLIDPLLEIRFRDKAALELAGVTGLLFTSGNGVRAFAALSARRDIAAYAVGDRTASLARTEGFAPVDSAGGDVASLVALVCQRRTPGDGVLLHVSGHDTVGDLAASLEAAGYSVRRAVLYDAEPASDLTPETQSALTGGTLDGVILFSPRTARHFAALVQLSGLAARVHGLAAWCLSPAVAEALDDLKLAAVHVAAEPTQAALLALIAPGATAVRPQEDVLTEAPPPTTTPMDEIPPEKTPKQDRVEPSITATLPPDAEVDPAADAAFVPPFPFEPLAPGAIDAPPPIPPSRPVKSRRSPLIIAGVVAIVLIGGVTIFGPAIRDKLDGAGDIPSPHTGATPAANDKTPSSSALTISDGPTLHADSTADTPAPDVSTGPHTMMPAHEPAPGAAPASTPAPTPAPPIAAAPPSDAAPVAAAPAPAPDATALPPIPAADTAAAPAGSGFTARLDADEARLDRLQQTAAPVQQGLASLGQRLAAIEAKPSVDPASVQAVAADLQRVTSSLNDAATRIARLELQVQQQASAQRDEKETVLAIAELRDRLAGSGPFDGPVGVLKSAAGSDPAMAPSLATLDRFAAQGVASRAKLAADLDALPAAINQPLPPAADAGLWDRMAARARKLFSIRRIDEDGTADKLPPGPDHSLAVAARTLKAGDLAGAIQAVQGLDGHAAEVAKPWLTEATDRLAVEAAVNRLGTVATQRLQGTGMPQTAPDKSAAP